MARKQRASLKVRRKRPNETPEEQEARREYFREWKRQNPERVKVLRKKYKQKHGHAAYLRQRERVLAWCKRRYDSDPEKIRTRVRRWAALNLLKVRKGRDIQNARRKAKMVPTSDPRFSMPVDFRVLGVYAEARRLRKQGHDVHVDHIIPLSKGGPHVFENLRIIPAKENMTKSARMPKLAEVPASLLMVLSDDIKKRLES